MEQLIIKSINIYGYGKWNDQKFEFNSSMQVIYGPNEAGKSTILDFIKSMIFGFQTKVQATHGQYIPKNGSPYGGEIVFEESGKLYKLIRTKGTRGGKIQFFDETTGESLTKADFLKMIDPIDRKIYDRIFYFGEYELNTLYKLSSEELQNKIHQIGLTSSSQWIELSKKFNKEIENLYAPKGTTRIINKQLNRYQTQKLELDKFNNNYSEYQQIKTNYDENKVKVSDLNDQINNQNKLLVEYKNYQHLLPVVQRFNELKSLSDDNIQTGFSIEDKQSLDALVQNRNLNEHELTELTDQITKLKEFDKNPDIEFYRANQNQIRELMSDLDAQLANRAKLEKLNNEIAESKNKISQLKNSFIKENHTQIPVKLTETDIASFKEIISQTDSSENLNNNFSKYLSVENYVFLPIVALIPLGLAIFFKPYIMNLVITSATLIILYLALIGIVMVKNPNKQRVRQFKKNNARLKLIAQHGNLTNYPQNEWLLVQEKLKQLDDLNEKLLVDQQQVSKLRDQLKNYTAKWSFFSSYLKVSVNNMNQLTDIVNQLILKNDRNQRNEVEISELKLKINTKKSAIQKINQQIKEFLNDRKQSSVDEFLKEYVNQQAIESRLNEKNILKQQLKGQDVDAIQATDWNYKIDVTQSRLSELQKLLSDLNQQQAEARLKITELTNSGKSLELRQTLENLKTEIMQNIKQLLALQLNVKLINCFLDLASQNRFPKISKLAERYFRILTNQKYQYVKFEDKIRVYNNNDEQFLINELSRGTLEQLYLALILALAVEFSKIYQFPIIIDDGLVNFDIQRKSSALELINDISKTNQIIYVTANNKILGSDIKSIIDLSNQNKKSVTD